MRIIMLQCNLCGNKSKMPMVSIVLSTNTEKYVMSSHDNGDFHLCKNCTKKLMNTFESVDTYYSAE